MKISKKAYITYILQISYFNIIYKIIISFYNCLSKESASFAEEDRELASDKLTKN